MSVPNFRLQALAGTSLLGIFVYYNTSSRERFPLENNESTNSKRESNTNSPNTGSTEATGDHEHVQSDNGAKGSTGDQGHKTGATAPKEKLTNGGVGGGGGAGGAGSRSIELSGTKPGGTSAGIGGDLGLSELVHTFASAGGKNTLEPGSSGDKMYDSKIASHHSETPTKRV